MHCWCWKLELRKVRLRLFHELVSISMIPVLEVPYFDDKDCSGSDCRNQGSAGWSYLLYDVELRSREQCGENGVSCHTKRFRHIGYVRKRRI